MITSSLSFRKNQNFGNRPSQSCFLAKTLRYPKFFRKNAQLGGHFSLRRLHFGELHLLFQMLALSKSFRKKKVFVNRTSISWDLMKRNFKILKFWNFGQLQAWSFMTKCTLEEKLNMFSERWILHLSFKRKSKWIRPFLQVQWKI